MVVDRIMNIWGNKRARQFRFSFSTPLTQSKSERETGTRTTMQEPGMHCRIYNTAFVNATKSKIWPNSSRLITPDVSEASHCFCLDSRDVLTTPTSSNLSSSSAAWKCRTTFLWSLNELGQKIILSSDTCYDDTDFSWTPNLPHPSALPICHKSHSDKSSQGSLLGSSLTMYAPGRVCGSQL